MGDERNSLFQGLPPPSSSSSSSSSSVPPPPQQKQILISNHDYESSSKSQPSNPPPPPVLKSALKKRSKPPQDSHPQASVPAKRLRFKTTTDASEVQVIEAMQKIASHIKNLSKVSKASKLAVQLIQAGSVKSGTSDHFFSMLEAAMSSPTACNDPSVRADYHALFSAAQDTTEYLSKKQRNQLTAWTVRAVLANDLFTDDSFVFSKASGRIKEAISQLPIATNDDDIEEAAALKDNETGDKDNQTREEMPSVPISEESKKEESDPFGLDALIPKNLKKEEKAKGKRDGTAKFKKEEDSENKRFLKSQREALIFCLEVAAGRYKLPWCQTVIDILVKHAFDNISRFTSQQRHAIEKLWVSIREQQARRKQGKSVSGKLDVNAFEHLQEKYANEKISIRRAVGGGGNRRAEQWLG